MATLVAAGAGVILAGPAAAATMSLEGGATQQGSFVELVADVGDAATTNDFSNVRISGLGLELADLQTLSAEFNATNDGCGSGSPYYAIHLGSGTVLNVAFGTFTPGVGFTCPTNSWESTGNLMTQFDNCRWNATGPGGTGCLTSLAAYAGQTITSIRLTVDASWGSNPAFADKEQTVRVRNLRINNERFLARGGGEGTTRPNPARQCRALQATMTPTAFRAMWLGVNANGANAFGKCVSTMAKAERQQAGNSIALQRAINADVRTCRAERRADPAAFRAKYGAAGAGIGKCVLAKAKPDLARLASTKTKPTRGRRP